MIALARKFTLLITLLLAADLTHDTECEQFVKQYSHIC